MAAPPGPRRGNPATAAWWRRRPRGSGRAGSRALESPARVPARAGAGRRDSSRRRRAQRTHPPDCRRRCAFGHRPGVRAPRSHEWSRVPPRSAVLPRWRGTSSWPRVPQSTAARTRSPPPPTRLERRSPPGRSARGPRGRAPRSRRGRRLVSPSRRRTTCRRHARGDRPTATASRLQAWRGAAPARHARRPRAGRRCERWLRRPPLSTDRRGTPRASCRRTRRRRRRLPPSTARAPAPRAAQAL